MKDCPFCRHIDPVIQNSHAMAIDDLYPVSEGHMLVIPKRHVVSYFDTTHTEKWAMLDLLDTCKEILDEQYSPDGYNIGLNVGKDAGQTVMHVHMHLIPRYHGDIVDPRGGVRGVVPDKRVY